MLRQLLGSKVLLSIFICSIFIIVFLHSPLLIDSAQTEKTAEAPEKTAIKKAKIPGKKMVIKRTPSKGGGTLFGKSDKDKDEPTIINSDSLIDDKKNKKAIFTGSVEAYQGDTKLYSDKMVVFYGEGQGDVKKIITIGNTKLIKGTKTIISDNSDYFAGEKKIVFMGSPKAIENGSTIRGSKIIYYIEDERFIVENSEVYIEGE